MSTNTKIEWTDTTGSPWLGCTKVSYRSGKRAAGRLLDGREHSEFPEVRP